MAERDVVIVETDRLILRNWEVGDLDELAAVFSDEKVCWFPFRRGFDRSETEEFIARQQRRDTTGRFALWAATLKPDGRIIGYVGLAIPDWLPEVMPAVEVGWRLHSSAWGQGRI